MTKKHLYIGLVAGILIIFLISNFVVEKRLSSLQEIIDDDITSDLTYLTELSGQMGNGQQNGTIDSLIQNCPTTESSEYDTLLGSLDKGLTYNELIRLDYLFKFCGQITANKKNGMVFLMNQKLMNLNKSVERRYLLGDFSKEDVNTAGWAELLEKENIINNLFSNLVSVQGKIIDALISGSSQAEIESIQTEAQKIRSELISAVDDASMVRSTLVSS